MAREEPLTPNRRQALIGLSAIGLAGAARAAVPLDMTGRSQQGGTLIGRTRPRAQVYVDGVFEGLASEDGYFVVGFDRDSALKTVIRVVTAEGEAEHVSNIAPGVFDIQKIDGLSDDQVNPQGEALLARIAAEAERKTVGFASRADRQDFRTGFILPLTKFRLSGHFGGQRVLNGVPKRPHYGDDLAAPIGTPIRAPAAGVVAFAETGLHFEGGLTLLDHGQGLITAYLHQSKVLVKQGEVVKQGQVMGAVGMEGRATGPHLCWRMKWHGRYLDPMLLVGVRAA